MLSRASIKVSENVFGADKLLVARSCRDGRGSLGSLKIISDHVVLSSGTPATTTITVLSIIRIM